MWAGQAIAERDFVGCCQLTILPRSLLVALTALTDSGSGSALALSASRPDDSRAGAARALHMAPIDSLPPELLSLILDHLGDGSEWTAVTHTLRRCALVLQAWRGPAQRALFASFQPRSEQSARAWIRSTARMRYALQRVKLHVGSITAAVESLTELLELPVMELVRGIGLAVWGGDVRKRLEPGGPPHGVLLQRSHRETLNYSFRWESKTSGP